MSVPRSASHLQHNSFVYVTPPRAHWEERNRPKSPALWRERAPTARRSARARQAQDLSFGACVQQVLAAGPRASAGEARTRKHRNLIIVSPVLSVVFI